MYLWFPMLLCCRKKKKKKKNTNGDMQPMMKKMKCEIQHLFHSRDVCVNVARWKYHEDHSLKIIAAVISCPFFCWSLNPEPDLKIIRNHHNCRAPVRLTWCHSSAEAGSAAMDWMGHSQESYTKGWINVDAPPETKEFRSMGFCFWGLLYTGNTGNLSGTFNLQSSQLGLVKPFHRCKRESKKNGKWNPLMWGFPSSWGIPIAGWFISRKIPLKLGWWLGVPPFQEIPSCLDELSILPRCFVSNPKAPWPHGFGHTAWDLHGAQGFGFAHPARMLNI